MFSRAVTEGINHHSQLICAGLSHSLFGWISANQAETDAASNAAARPVYPFSAIIGQEEMKFAAIMNIIDPNIGGIMVMGDRGTGKSTTVRSLVRFWLNESHLSPFTFLLRQVDLLPLIDVLKDDPFMSSPTDPNLMSPDILKLFREGYATMSKRFLCLYFTYINCIFGSKCMISSVPCILFASWNHESSHKHGRPTVGRDRG